MESFQILISTMDDNFFKRDYKLGIPHIIINQLNKKSQSDYILNDVYSYKEKGLSKSRNKALFHADKTIALISDDDVDYLDDIEYIISKVFEDNPSADIITFQFLKDNYTLYKKNYKKEKFWHDIYSLARVSSVEVAFRVDKIKNNNVKFDQNFGLGSLFPTGEEYIFLSDALKKGLKILYVPIPILVHRDISSGGQFIDNTLLLEAKGALFYRIFGTKAYFVSFAFAYRKYKTANIGLIKFYRLMLSGIKKYKELKS